MGKHELMKHFRGLILETVALLKQDLDRMEKIKKINTQIDDGKGTLELHLLKDMIELHHKEVEFEHDYLSSEDNVKIFKQDLTKIAQFLLKNESKI